MWIALPFTWGAAIVLEPLALAIALVATRREPPPPRFSLIRAGLFLHALLVLAFAASVLIIIYDVLWG